MEQNGEPVLGRILKRTMVHLVELRALSIMVTISSGGRYAAGADVPGGIWGDKKLE